MPSKTQSRQEQQTEGNGYRVLTLPPVPLPAQVREPQNLVYYGAIGSLALVGIIEWPVALLVGAGYALLASKKSAKITMSTKEEKDEF